MAHPPRWLAALRESTHELLAALDGLTDADARRPSLLPGWTVGHVLTHLARNGDGLARCLDGARRGVQVPAYPGGDAGRDRDIADGAGRDAAALVADVADSAARFDEVCAALDAEAWERTTVPRAAPLPAHDLVRLRWQEVEIHRVDLDLGYGPQEWPAEFVSVLLANLVATSLPGRLPADVTVELAATDTGQHWTVGTGARRTAVSGPSWALACWLTGRDRPVRAALDGELPDLGRWA